MRAAPDGRHLQLYNRHAASSAAARRRHRLASDLGLVYAACLRDVGVLRPQRGGCLLRKYRGDGDLYRNAGESDMRIPPPDASGGIP